MRPSSSQGGMYRLPSYMRASTTGLTTARTARPKLVPREFLIRNLKEKRKFRLLSRKLTVFVTFVIIYIAVLLLDRNISGRSVVRRIIATDLLETSRASSGITFSAIHSIATFWDWFQNSFIEAVYSSNNADGTARDDDEMYTVASHTIIVGGFHILQTRFAALDISAASTKGERCYSTLAPVLGLTCYSSNFNSEEAFGHTNGTASSRETLASLDMFKYTTSEVTGASGFQSLFLRSKTDGDDERRRASLMQEFRWVDRQTREVEIIMPLYNRNLKLWSVVDLTITFDLAGGVTPSSFVHVANLEPYDFTNNRNLVRGVLEAIFIAHVVYFFFLELWDVCVLANGSLRVYMARYGIINNLGDWGNIIVNVAICAWRYFCQSNATRAKLLAIQSFEEYVPAGPLALWDELLLGMNICNMLLVTGRALKYFQVTNGGRRLMASVYGAMPEVMSFLPIYFSVIVGYTFAGHMLYGLRFPEWSTFPRAFFRVFELNFGLYDPGPIYDAGGYLSAIFIYSSNVVFCILMLNVFMAIVMSTWDQLSEQEAEKAQERKDYSSPMTLYDMVHLLLMKEEVVDTLLDIALDLEDTDRVSLAVFTKEWQTTGMEVSPKTWERIVSWYWDPTTALSGATTTKPSLGIPLDRKTSGVPNVDRIIEDTDDFVQVINSARELNTSPDLPQTQPKPVGATSSRSRRASAKVVAVADDGNPEAEQ